MLSELRDAFSHYGQPEKLATASLLIWLHHDPDAPWNQEGLITSSRLAAILRPFNIFPRQQKKKGEANHRGYTMQNFLYTWDQLLPREPSMNRDTSRREPMPDPPKPTPADEASVRAFKASDAQPLGSVSPNKNAGGINSSTTSEVSKTGVNPSAAAGRNLSPVTSNLSPGSSTQAPRANGQGQVLINKNAAGINSSTGSEVSKISANQRKSAAESSLSNQQSKINNQQFSPPPSPMGAASQGPVLPMIDPRMKGILDDPYNYFRQYPDSVGKAKMDKLVNVDHFWPQPADDKMPPDHVFHFDDGTTMPFTTVNRHPTDPKPILGLPQFYTQRWPVMLNEKERLQVAVARFHELRAAAKAELEKQKAEQAANAEQQRAAVS